MASVNRGVRAMPTICTSMELSFNNCDTRNSEDKMHSEGDMTIMLWMGMVISHPLLVYKQCHALAAHFSHFNNLLPSTLFLACCVCSSRRFPYASLTDFEGVPDLEAEVHGERFMGIIYSKPKYARIHTLAKERAQSGGGHFRPP